MLAPFAATVLLGGAALAWLLSQSGLLGPEAGGPLAPREAALEAPPRATDLPSAIDAQPLSNHTPAANVTLICDANADRYLLTHPDGAPAVNATRLLVPPGEGDAYLIADGRLLRLPLDGLAGEDGILATAQAEAPGRLAGGVPLQELVDLDYDPDDRAVLVLDKSGRVFGYQPAEGRWALVRQPDLAPDDEADPSYLAMAVDGGRVSLLDADLNQVWHFAIAEGQHSTPDRLFPSAQTGAAGVVSLEEGVDLLVRDDIALVLDTSGTLHHYDAADRRPALDVPLGGALPFSLGLGGGQLTVVDGLARSVATLEADDGQPTQTYQLSLPDMGLLRDAAFDAQGRLLALADNTLVAYTPGAPGDCPPPAESSALPDYYGADLATALAGFRFPIDGARLPQVPRAYPGARRLYRAGVHQGLDIYPWDTAGGFDIGEPVRAMQDGVVVRADVNYQPLGNAEFNRLTGQALALGFTPPETLDRIGGRQVHIAHANGVETRYLHLDSVALGITPGAAVTRGQIIGTVGVSGTGREADESFVTAHLHTEIWVGDHYLGHGLSLRETMWLWGRVFPSLEGAAGG